MEKKFKRIVMTYYASRDFLCRRYHSFMFENYEDEKFDGQDFEPVLRFTEKDEHWFKQDVLFIEMPSIFGEKDLPVLENGFKEAQSKLSRLENPRVVLFIWGDDHDTKYDSEKDFHDFAIPFKIDALILDGNIAFFKTHKIPFRIVQNIKQLTVHKFRAELNLREIPEYFDIKEGELKNSIKLEDFQIDMPYEFSQVFKLENKTINVDIQNCR